MLLTPRGGFLAAVIVAMEPLADGCRVDEAGAVLQAACVPEPPARAGIARLDRAVDAARTLAARGRHAQAERVLRRAAMAFVARGDRDRAAQALCRLGELYLDRARPKAARAAFEQATRVSPRPLARSVFGAARALLDDGCLADAESACRTALGLSTEPAQEALIRGTLAELFWLRGSPDAAEEILRSGPQPLTCANAALLSRIRLAAGDVVAAVRLAVDALHGSEGADPRARCEAHAWAARAYAELGHGDAVRREMATAQGLARTARLTCLRIRLAAEGIASLARCGERASRATSHRLLQAARWLSPLDAARVRAALDPDSVWLRRFVRSSGAIALAEFLPPGHDLIPRFQAMLDAIHNSPDERTALRAIATDLLTSLDVSSVVVRSGRPLRAVAAAGHAWHGDAALADAAMKADRLIWRPGPALEAAGPVRDGGSTIGTIAVRWVADLTPGRQRSSELLNIAAIAAAPLLRTIPEGAPTQPGERYPDELLGRGPAADLVREAVRRAAQAPFPVLIEAESGAGKELVARAIHARSSRRGRRFCALNCAALTDDLLEAELFGHARGAFTGAITDRPGLFEDADAGTLFLDEVTELSGRAQAKLLRVVQDGDVRRVGENAARRVDARIVAASNHSLEDAAASGKFRDDLRFRLDVIRIRIPPLRERADDIPWLTERIWSETARRVGTHATLGPDLVAALTRYQWPGNVRELQNVLAAIAVQAPRRGRVDASLLPNHIARSIGPAGRGLGAARTEFERQFVRAALARCGGRKTAAAAELGISRQGLAKILKRLELAAIPEPAGRD